MHHCMRVEKVRAGLAGSCGECCSKVAAPLMLALQQHQLVSWQCYRYQGVHAFSSTQQLQYAAVPFCHGVSVVTELRNMTDVAGRATNFVLQTNAGHTDVMLESVYNRLEGLCQGHSEVSVSVGDVVAAACRLGSIRLILCDAAAKRLYMRLSLNVPVDDLSHVLKNEDSISWLQTLDF